MELYDASRFGLEEAFARRACGCAEPAGPADRGQSAHGTTARGALLTDSHGTVEARSAAPSPAILIVDDDAGKRLAVRAMLASLGHALVEAESGRAALRAVLRQDFALILMDVRMPTLDGYETARLIRQRSQTRLTPIIFVTASVEEHPLATATAYASGAVDFIFTPVHADVLRIKVSTYVDLFVQSQELKILNAALRDSEARARSVAERGGRDRDHR